MKYNYKLNELIEFFYSFNINGTFKKNNNDISLTKIGRIYFVKCKNNYYYIGSTLKDVNKLFETGNMQKVFKFLNESI